MALSIKTRALAAFCWSTGMACADGAAVCPTARAANRTMGRRRRYIMSLLDAASINEAARTLANQDRPAIHVENFSCHESRMRSAQKQNRSGDFRRSTYASHRNRAEYCLARFRVVERRLGHVGLHPSGCDAVDIDAVPSKFRRKPLH